VHRRVADPPPMQLTQRDRQVIQAIHQYRFLRRDQIQALLFPSRNTANRRLQGLLRADELNHVQKAQEILKLIRQRRFPAIAEAESRFEKLKKELKPGSGIKLTAPKNFEQTAYSLNLSFNTLTELKERRDGIERLLKNKTLREFIP